MFKEIPKSNITVRPFKVYKEWQFDEAAIPPLYGIKITGSLFYPDLDVTNSNGVSKRMLYETIRTQCYANPATSSLLTEVGYRTSYTNESERVIGDVIGVISVPQVYYGEGIQPNSVSLSYSTITATDDGFSNLKDGDDNHVGNVFYDRGLIVITDSVVDDDTINSFDLSYKSTVTIYENEILINVLEGEFNVSQNPTAYDYDSKLIKYSSITSSLNPSKVGGFGDYFYSSSVDPTGSYLTTYITTIGLYDNDGNMVVTAKLPQPIKNFPDYPLNFIIKFDT